MFGEEVPALAADLPTQFSCLRGQPQKEQQHTLHRESKDGIQTDEASIQCQDDEGVTKAIIALNASQARHNDRDRAEQLHQAS